jgi:hypothetical protein
MSEILEAKDSEVGRNYIGTSGIAVCILSKNNKVLVRSDKTGNVVEIPPTYLLTKIEGDISMAKDTSTEDNSATATATPAEGSKRGKKSHLIDEALRQNLSTDEIVQKVLTEFPDLAEKNVRNLVSVRRSKLKKASSTATNQ